MKAFWDRTCESCHKPIPKGTEMRYADKKAWHPDCFPAEEPNVFDLSEAHHVADRLGYVPHDEAIRRTT